MAKVETGHEFGFSTLVICCLTTASATDLKAAVVGYILSARGAYLKVSVSRVICCMALQMNDNISNLSFDNSKCNRLESGYSKIH